LPFYKPEDIKIPSYIGLANIPSNDKVDLVASIGPYTSWQVGTCGNVFYCSPVGVFIVATKKLELLCGH